MSDVTNQKNLLRNNAKQFRKNLPLELKKKKDYIIFNKIIALNEYKTADNVLCYVSGKNEIDTLQLIEYSLKNGKAVAVPKCCDADGEMNFYYISSLSELEIGKFGIMEPSEKNKIFENCDNSICIVPSLMVDKNKFRLGFGKGYYDRFLARFSGFKCVVCYKDNVVEKLPIYSEFDIKSDVCITD